MTIVWKLIPTVLLGAILIAGLTARPPRTPVTPAELIRLVLSIVGLYLAGGGALLAHRTGLAAVAFGAGLALCALAVWWSRGGTPPPRQDDGERDVPVGPVGPPDPVSPVEPVEFDWSFYEEQVRDLGRGEPTERPQPR
jgi:hypothetical protein